jgi:hypothetical protein
MSQRVTAQAERVAEIARAGADAALGADDQDAGRCRSQGGGDAVAKLGGVGHGRHGPAMAAGLLRRPGQQGKRRAGIARPVAEGGDAAAGLVGQVFQIVERAAALAEAAQRTGPAGCPL